MSNEDLFDLAVELWLTAEDAIAFDTPESDPWA